VHANRRHDITLNEQCFCAAKVLSRPCLSWVDAVEKCRCVVGFSIGGVFGLFLAERRSLIGKHHDQPGKPLTQSPHRLPLLAGRLDAAPLS
jgi:hypothetical protein